MTKMLSGLLSVLLVACLAEPACAGHPGNPHYNAAGFFDVHVCNWPDRPVFFMTLFSSTRYNEIRSVEVRTPQGKVLTELDLSRYRLIGPADKPTKKVFIRQVAIPQGSRSGWYSARVVLTSGAVLFARDYVDLGVLGRVTGQQPANEAVLRKPPQRLHWHAVKGARFYQVFVRDNWDDGREIYRSKLLASPFLDVPAGLLQPGGYYSWVVHARDVNEDIRLGDFNRGSLSKSISFTIAP